MSNKPPKKSDANKQWMKARRDRGMIIKPEYHLIVAEGEKTEPNYFGELKKDIGTNGDRIRIEIPTRKGSRDPIELVSIAQKYVRQYSNKGIYLGVV